MLAPAGFWRLYNITIGFMGKAIMETEAAVMTIEIHAPELEQRVKREIEKGQFHDMHELLTRALDALEKEGATEPVSPASGTPMRLVDALMSPPFRHSELYIPPRHFQQSA
jgi:hypothetical protein